MVFKSDDCVGGSDGDDDKNKNIIEAVNFT